MTPAETAAALKAAVYTLGAAYGECPQTLRRARAMGLTGWGFYVAGRGGVLGDVRPEVVASAMGFIALDAVRDGWHAARRTARPTDIAEASLAECCRWGRERLDGFAGVARLADLAGRVAAAADAAGLTLFGAWRSTPAPEDGPGARAAVALHLLREFRGGVHLLAVRAVGLTPIEAIVAGPEGPAGAMAFGWQPPYPEIAPLFRRRANAEVLTDRLAGDAFRALVPAERAELVSLVSAAREVVTRKP
ncbi:hypothetical protein AB0M43_34515 [Longispora sp. NPDC051575]|uniref:SCO6745 family protein n=1 Tax=Longispora sp. NPDC051575 TaxID=3154943 RepID=UPI00342AC1F5